jgi:hypothetical protein
MKSIRIFAVIITILTVFAMQVANGQMRVRNSQGTVSQTSVWTGSQILFSQVSDAGPNFRAITVGDFYGDGNKDIVWQNITQGTFGDVRIWNNIQSSNETYWRQVKQVWDVQVVGDLDGDGFDDIVWRYMVPGSGDTGVSFIWFTNGSSVTQPRKRGGAPLTWALIGAKDINGDRAADMVYISPENQIRVLMATPNRTCANFGAGNIASGFTAIKFADFSGNRRGEILTRNQSTGEVQLIGLQANGITLPPYTGAPDDPLASCTTTSTVIPSMVTSLGVADPSWTFYASVDLNNDGVEDIVWLHPNGNFIVWMMNFGGTVTQIANAGTAPVGYTAVHPFGKPSTQVFPPKLIMSAASGQANNGPVSVFDLNSGSVQNLQNNAGGCDGASLNPVTQKVMISCRSGSQPYVSYDPKTATTNTNALALASQGTVNTPVVCAVSGKCFYGFGIGSTPATADGRVVVTQDGLVQKTVPLPDQNSVKFPVRMKIIGVTVYILSRGSSGMPASVSRFDLVTEQFVGSPIQLGSDAWDMAVNENLIAVSISRNSAGKDVLFFDATTGTQTNSLTVPGSAGNFNAFGLTIKGNNLYVTEATRVSSYSLNTFTQTRMVMLPSYGFEITSSSRSIYVAIFETNMIYELDPGTLEITRQWSKPVGSGRLYVAE